MNARIVATHVVASTLLLAGIGTAHGAAAQDPEPTLDVVNDTTTSNADAVLNAEINTQLTDPTESQGVEGTAFADVIGRTGIGYFNGTAPLGIRQWFNETLGFDAGVGLGLGTEPETSWNFNVEGALLYAIGVWQNMVLYGRGGLGFGLDDVGPGGASFNMFLSGMIAGEFFMTALGFPNLSFTGGIGAQFGVVAPDGGDLGVAFNTFQSNVSLITNAILGFRIYM